MIKQTALSHVLQIVASHRKHKQASWGIPTNGGSEPPEICNLILGDDRSHGKPLGAPVTGLDNDGSLSGSDEFTLKQANKFVEFFVV